MRQLLLAFAFTTILTPDLYAQQEVGSGGDPVELIFGKARVDALTVLQAFAAHVDRPGLDERFTPDVLAFLQRPLTGRRLYQALAADVRDSEHIFFDPDIVPIEQSTCARTSLPTLPPTTVRFSLPKCRLLLNDQGMDLAVVVLLHEATHHFGVGASAAEELFAWSVGNQLFAFWEFVRDRERPHWQHVTMSESPAARYQHSTTLIDQSADTSRVFVWGGCNYSMLPDRESCEQFLRSGAVLTVKQDGEKQVTSWQSTREPQSVSGRKLHTTALALAPGATAPQLMTWGGCNGPDASCSAYPTEGGLYDPQADTWNAFPAPAGVPGRIHHSGLATGDGLFVFGGLTAGRRVLSDAYRLHLHQDSVSGTAAALSVVWEPLAVPTQMTGRYGHSTVAAGDAVVIWGGCSRRGLVDCVEYRNDGWLYAAGQWTELPPVPWPFAGRAFHAAAVVGRQMLVWGGKSSFTGVLDDGAILDLDTLQWTPVAGLLPPGEGGRYAHEMSAGRDGVVIFGGESGRGEFQQSVLHLRWLASDPSQQSWRRIDTDTAPIGRKGHSQVWLPQGLLIWGGYAANQTFLPNGAILRRLQP